MSALSTTERGCAKLQVAPEAEFQHDHLHQVHDPYSAPHLHDRESTVARLLRTLANILVASSPAGRSRPESKARRGLEVTRPSLQVQTLGGHNVSPDLLQAFFELLHQVVVAHDLGGLGHLPQQLFKTAKQPNQRTLVDFRHFAIDTISRDGGGRPSSSLDLPNLGKRPALSPAVNRFHQLPLEARDVRLLIHVELALLADLGDDTRLGLDLSIGLL